MQRSTKNETISVIVPVYKVEQYLDRCIRSVAEQTYRDLEIILIDDGSPDRSGEICDIWARKDDRICVFHQKNAGASTARNVGLDKAAGAYIAFVDSDDWIHPDMMEKLHQSMIEHEADIVVSYFDMVNEQGALIHSRSRGKKRKDAELEKTDVLRRINFDLRLIVLWNKLYRKDVFHNIRLPADITIGEDACIIHKLFSRCEKIWQVPFNLYNYTKRPFSITDNSLSIKRLDDVQARYERVLFYEQEGFTELLDETTRYCVYWYLKIRNDLFLKSPEEKRRLKEVKRMVRYCYLRHGKQIRVKDIVNIECPRLFRILLKIKRLNSRMCFSYRR